MRLVWLSAVACSPKSESVADPSAGDNGGFEVFRDGLPVQWQVYTPRTVPSGAFLVTSDADVYLDGERSLRFDVQTCSPEGGWRSPGIAREWEVEPGLYRVGIGVRAERAAVRVSAASVTASDGAWLEIPSGAVDGEWHRAEGEIDVPAGARLRFEVSVVAPGTVWVDNFRAERVERR